MISPTRTSDARRSSAATPQHTSRSVTTPTILKWSVFSTTGAQPQPDVRIACAARAAVALGVQQDDASIGFITSLQQLSVSTSQLIAFGDGGAATRTRGARAGNGVTAAGTIMRGTVIPLIPCTLRETARRGCSQANSPDPGRRRGCPQRGMFTMTLARESGPRRRKRRRHPPSSGRVRQRCAKGNSPAPRDGGS